MRKAIILSAILTTFMLVTYVSKISAQESGLFSLDKAAYYDITVELTQGLVSKIKNVTVTGVTEIGNKTFLIALSKGILKAENALINLDNVKTILPSSGVTETIISVTK